MFLLATLPGFPCMVPVARAMARNALVDCPRRDDAVQIVSEFVTTSVLHSHSRGLRFELSLEINPGQLRIQVQDGGPFGYPPRKPMDAPACNVHPWITLYEEDQQRDHAAEVQDFSRGLAIVTAASDKWGNSRYPSYGVWWAELAWPDPTAAALVNGSIRTLAEPGCQGFGKPQRQTAINAPALTPTATHSVNTSGRPLSGTRVPAGGMP